MSAFVSGSPAHAEGENIIKDSGKAPVYLTYHSHPQNAGSPRARTPTGGNLVFLLKLKVIIVSPNKPVYTLHVNKALKRVKIASNVAVQWIPRPQRPGCLPAA